MVFFFATHLQGTIRQIGQVFPSRGEHFKMFKIFETTTTVLVVLAWHPVFFSRFTPEKLWDTYTDIPNYEWAALLQGKCSRVSWAYDSNISFTTREMRAPYCIGDFFLDNHLLEGFIDLPSFSPPPVVKGQLGCPRNFAKGQ